MTTTTQPAPGRFLNPWRVVGWGSAALLLSLPAILDFPWTASDFVIMGIMFAVVGLGLEFLCRRSGSISYRFGAGLALLAGFLLVWANLAVGMIGSEDNPYNLIFIGALGIAVLGAPLVRFRASGMAAVMIAAGTVQVLAGGAGMFADVRGGIFSIVFAFPWFLSAVLFRNAATQ